MEFKKIPHRQRRPQSTPPPSRQSRSSQNTSVPPTSDRAQPIMSGRSLKNQSRTKTQSSTPLRSFLLSKKAIVLTSLLLIIVIGLLIVKPSRQDNPSSQANQNSQDTKAHNDQSTSPEKVSNPPYSTVAPKGKTIEELGGWRRVSPAKSTPVYAYTDKIGDVAINVSQQPLPDSFKDNVDSQVAELAKKFNATASFNAGATKVYMGTSAKGPQSVIFTTKKLLILIKSQKTVDTKAWTNYINSLT